MSPKQQLIAKGIFIASTLFSLAMTAFVTWSVVTVSPLHPAGSAPSQGVSIGLALAIGLFVMAFNYLAYRGLTEPVKGFKLVFWCFIALHLFALPVGTAIALTLIYLWNQSRTYVIRPLGATL
ncbi:hypothetical protein ACWIJ6_08295 [Aeromonas piscicola]